MKECDDIVEALGDGAEFSEAQSVHAKRCPPCGALVAIDHQLKSVGDATQPLQQCAALREALAQDHAPVKPRTPIRRAAPVIIATAVICVFAAVEGRRGPLAIEHPMLFWGAAGFWLAMLVGGLSLTLYRGRAGLGVSAPMCWIYVTLSAVTFEMLAFVSAVPGDVSWAAPGHEWVHHLLCASFGTVVAAIVGVLLFRAARHTAVVSPESAGAAAGTAAGMAGALLLQLGCSTSDSTHVAVAHVMPIVLGALVGMFAGRRILAP